MIATLILFGGPCAGRYDIDSAWPPLGKIRVAHDGNGGRAILADDFEGPAAGEQVIEYEISSWGYACKIGRSKPLGAHAVYFQAGRAPARIRRASAIAAAAIEVVL